MESQRTIWTAIIVLIVGIALIFLRSTAIDIVVMVLGAMFVAASALNLFFLFRTPTVTVSGGKVRRVSVSFGSLVAAVAAGALGIWMLFDPSSMSSLIVYVFVRTHDSGRSVSCCPAGFRISSGPFPAPVLCFSSMSDNLRSGGYGAWRCQDHGLYSACDGYIHDRVLCHFLS